MDLKMKAIEGLLSTDELKRDKGYFRANETGILRERGWERRRIR